jgi:hypothetical protein
MATPRLRDLPASLRLALSCVVLVFLGGLAASAKHLVHHHENRDGEPGVSLVDLEGAYRGVEVRSPLVTSLERGHPADVGAELAEADRKVLLDWLASGRISEDYDNLDLGDLAPAEVLAKSCSGCHSRQSEDPLGRRLPLDYWDDVNGLAFSQSIEPLPEAILAATTHTHALAMASMTVAILGLWLLTRWPTGLKQGLALLACASLAVDLAGWWLARDLALFVVLIAVTGSLYALSITLALLGTLVDLWLPARRAG